MMKRCASVIAAMMLLSSASGTWASEQGPIPIALVELEYEDTSGEPQDQTEVHKARIQMFMRSLKEDLDRGGHFKTVEMSCGADPCSIEDTDPDELIAAAKKAGAKLMLYGGIHKVSTLIQFAKVQVADVDRNEAVMYKSMSFRGDDDRSWLRMQQFLVKQMGEELVK
jgi:hypothetical protein